MIKAPLEHNNQALPPNYRMGSHQSAFTELINTSVMRGTNNSMGTLIDDHARTRPVYQTDDRRRLSREASRATPYDSNALEDRQDPVIKPCPHPTPVVRSNNPHRHVHRTFWIVIQDIEATKNFHKHENYKRRNAKASFEALDHLIHQYKLQHKNRSGVICQPSGDSLRGLFQSVWGSHKSEDTPEGTQQSKTAWLASMREWDPSYLLTIEDACTELTLEDSLPVYDPARAEPFDADADGHGDAKGSRVGRAGSTGDKQSDRIVDVDGEGDDGSEIGQPVLDSDSINVSPMVVVKRPTQSPSIEPQKPPKKGSSKVCLKTHVAMT